jgi:predicted Ser/Thr protein kinase/intein/homing endonuclease
MDLVKRLGEYRDRERELAWEGTFAQYFEIATKQPSVAQLSHERIYNMMMAAGVETTRSGDPRYKFFGQDIFGLDKPLQQIVEYFHSAAQRLEVRKRILLLMGPVGGGKSTIVYLLKRGLEQYTRSQEGATYAIKECPMHEEPLHLIPQELRAEVEREFGLYIEGDLCPSCRWMVEEKYGGKIEEVPVKRVAFSEKNRIGIGTFTPSDPKCVTGDTLVLTSDGLRSMEDIYLSLPRKPREDEFVPFETTVLGINGPEQATQFYYGGLQPIYKVETNLGYTIRGTANHPLLTQLPGGETAWKKIGNLQPGDYVAVVQESGIFGQSATNPLGDTHFSHQRPQAVLGEQPALAATLLATRAQPRYLWATVQQVRPAGIEPVYDLLVPGTHSFVADGFVQHNSQDISELVGGIDLSTIGEVGVESDPRAYRFDGELNIANRGIMEFIEILKCASGSSLVYTHGGIRRLDSFAQPDHPEGASREVEIQLATSTGLETATHLYHAGKKPIKRVMTRRGFVSEGAHEHRIQVVNEEGVQVWRRHDELKVGDWVVMQKGQNLWGQDVEITWKQPQTQAQVIRVPERMTPGLARWLGYLIAEGCTRSGTIDFANSEEELRADFCQLTVQLFGVQPTPKPERILIGSKALVSLLHYLGFKTGAYKKELPWSVLQSSRECVLEFLAGYFAGDGTVKPGGHISWTTASDELAKQLQIVLLNLGIVTRRVINRTRASKDVPYQDYWMITASGEDADRLASLMRLIPARKLLSYEKLRAKRQWRDGRADLIPHTEGYWVAISDELQRAVKARALISAGGPRYRAREGARQILGGDYINLHALHTGTNTCTRQMATAILGKLEGWVEPPPGLSALLNPSQFYDEVVSIEDDEADCWDFHVPGSNTFIANGFINHNCDEKFLYVLLTLSQEQNIKTGRFSMIYADEVVVSHTNEAEYQAFVGNRKSEALQDRIILVKVPYNMRVSDEVKIYEKLLKQSALQGVHIAPNTLRIASIFAVLTRLEPSKKAGMSLMKKLKLYDGEDLEDFKQKDIRELQEEAQREGMDGISPRYIINRLSSALVRENTTCINPIDALRALRDGMDQHTGLSREQRERYLNFISEARKEFDELAKKEIQRAFVYSYEESARTLLNNYLDNVEAYCNKTKVRDPITDEDMEPDEQLMRSIEEQIGISDNAKKAFREEILIRISSLARRGQAFDYTSHERLKEAIEKKLFADLRDVVKITTSSRTPDAEQLKKINEVVSRLIQDHGYCHVCANELLKYAGSLLNR